MKSRPADVGELVRMASLLPLWVLIGNTLPRLAPIEPLASLQLPAAPQVVFLLAIFLLLASVVIVVRVVLGAIERERLDPMAAEMELSELVWREHRGELARTSAFLAKASRRDKRFSSPERT